MGSPVGSSRVPGLALIAVVLIAGVAPVVWDPWGVQAFLHPKLLVVGIGLLVAGVAVSKTGTSLPTDRWIRYAIGGFVVIACLATVFSAAPLVALFGSAARQLGLLVWLAHVAVGLVAMNLFPGKPRRALVWVGTSLSCGVVLASVFALLEAADASPFVFNQSFGGRVQSVMGNPAALGAYLVLGLPLALALGLDASLRPSHRVIGWVGVALGVPSLILTGSRGAWLGAAAIVIVGAVAMLRGSRRARRWALLAGLLVVLAILATLPSGRWGTLGEAGEGRLALWEVGADTVLANPVLGVGPEGFGLEFGEHVNEDFVIKYSREQVYDRAHNGVIDVAADFGLPGLVCYLVVLGGVLAVAGRAVVSGETLFVVAGGSVVGYVVQQQTYFQVSVIDAAFWLLVGVLASSQVRVRRSGTGRWLPLGVVLLGFAIAVYAGLGIRADHHDKRALATADPLVALDSLEAAAAIRPFDNVHYLEAASIARELPDPTVVADILDLIRSGRRYAPTDELMILAEVNLLNQVYRLTGDQGRLVEGDELLTSLIDRDPTNGEAYLRLGTSAYYRGDYASAEADWLRAEVLLPTSSAPRSDLDVLHGELDK
jgi:hypothetical protein